jgi:hypothetical protein
MTDNARAGDDATKDSHTPTREGRMTETKMDASTRCFEATARVERIVHLPVMCADNIDGDLWDWLEESDAFPVIATALGLTPEAFEDHLNQFGGQGRQREDGRRESFQEAVNWKLRDGGWLVEVHQPVMEKRGTGASFSWGYTASSVHYGTTYDEALDTALTWAEEQQETVLGG